MPDLERLIQAIDAAEEYSYGSDGNQDLQEDRARALDYYIGRNIEPAPEGRSQVVDRSVFETIQWILPSLCRIFANGDAIVEFAPLGEDDEEAAQQESDYLNYLVTQKNPWFQIFLDWSQDALVSKNGYCLVSMEEKLHTEEETYEGQSAEAVTMLVDQEGVEVVAFEQYPDEHEQEPVMDPMGQPVLDPMTGQPMMQPRMLHNITIKRVKPEKRLRFKVLPPERCKVHEQTDSFSLAECDYFEFWDYCTISSLRQQGFDVPDDIASSDEEVGEEDFARDIYLERTSHSEINTVDPAMKLVRARMIWIRHDYDDDGISELMHCWRIGQTILEKDGKPYIENVTRIPVSSIVPLVNTHRHIGTSMADMSADIQRIKTAILRGGLDSLYLSLNQRHAVSNEVMLEDMLVSRPGGLVRMAAESSALPAEGHILPLTTQFVFPEAMQGLEYMDAVREGRTGVNRSFSGVEADILTKAQSGTAINQLSTMAAQRVEQIARIMASGVEYLFSLAHELILRHGHRKEVVKLRGKWVTIDPATWKTGRDMRIVVGFGAGNKDALVARLVTILQAQKEAMAGGLRVASEQNVYEALIELTKAADFSAPERFWTDPSTLPPPQPQEDPLIAAQKLIEGERIASNERIKQAELMQKEQQGARDDALKRDLANLEAELKIVLERMQHGGDVELERVRASLQEINGRAQASA